MKRIVLFVFLGILAITLIACNNEPDPTPTPFPPTEEAPAEATDTAEPEVAVEEVVPEPTIGTAVVDSVAVNQENNTVSVMGNFPDGCTQIHESTQAVDGNTINIELTTIRPADMMCTAALEPYTEEIQIDASGLADGEYTVEVNGVAGDQPIVVGETSTTVEQADLININWQWADLTETEPAAQSAVPMPENYTITFFEDFTLSIKADCNQVGGTYTLEGDLLTIQTGPSTMAFCGENSLDQQYLALLALVSNVAGENGRLNLITSEDARLGFNNGGDVDAPISSPSDSETQSPVTNAYGKTWQWTQFNDPVNGAQAIPEPERYQLVLNEDGTINVKADCNQVNGTYTTDGGSITIEFGPSTAAACPEDSLADDFIQHLSAAATIFFQDDSMYFDTFADSGTMKFDEASESSDSSTADSSEILDTIWQWTTFYDPASEDGPLEINDPSRYQIQLNADETIFIQADCNNGSGTYSVDGSNITIIIGPMTRAACPEDSLADDFIKNLEAVGLWFTEEDDLLFDLIFDSGTMRFIASDDSAEESTSADPSEIDEEATTESLQEETVSMSLQGLAQSFEWAVQPGYPPSPGPGGFGMPPHILVTFDGEDPEEVLSNNGRRLYIFPNEAYQTIVGAPVIAQVEQLELLIDIGVGTDPMPLLPPPSSYMDRWAQYANLDFTQGTGVRYVSDLPSRQQIGVWANDTTHYYYQGLTADGRFYLSLIWPVSTEALPNTADEAPEDVKAAATNPDTNAEYMEATIEELNGLTSADFDPKLDRLDALAASIRLQN